MENTLAYYKMKSIATVKFFSFPDVAWKARVFFYGVLVRLVRLKNVNLLFHAFVKVFISFAPLIITLDYNIHATQKLSSSTTECFYYKNFTVVIL